MSDTGRIYFEYQFSQIDPKISVTISPDADLSTAIEAFQSFLLAAGYFLPEGTVLDFVEDKSTVNEDVG